MKKVGIMTFHAAHNYGAMLQAYALQRFVNTLDSSIECEIINYRNAKQREHYALFVKTHSVESLIGNTYRLLNYRNIKRRYDAFESFITDYERVSACEYRTIEELSNTIYDCYISGSDQIWNMNLIESDIAYFLPFVKSGRRISYAPSFGHHGITALDDTVKDCLRRYDALSVRDENSRRLVEEAIGKDVPIMPDPTLLLKRQEWDKLSDDNICNVPYIYYYSFWPNKQTLDALCSLSLSLQCQVVISRLQPKYAMTYLKNRFRVLTDVSAIDFLRLIRHAKLVVTTSFHATVFSMLFQTPFVSIDGMSDHRISTLLERTGLVARAPGMDGLMAIDKGALLNVDFSRSIDAIAQERKAAGVFLKNAL